MPEQKTPVSGHGRALPTLSPADLTPDREGEPRVLDIILADRLGFNRPRDIRKLIEQNRAELEGYGSLIQISSQEAVAISRRDAANSSGVPSPQGGPNSGQPTGRGRGRPGRVFLLTEDQARLTAVLSRAPHAPTVRRQLIEAFNAYRAGLRPASTAAPSIADPVADAIARLVPTDGAEWHGAPADLLAQLVRFASDADRQRLGWPRSPRDLGIAVDRLRPELERYGIMVERRRGEQRVIRLWRRPVASIPAPHAPPSPAAPRSDPGELARLRAIVARQAEDLGALRGRLDALEILTGRAA